MHASASGRNDGTSLLPQKSNDGSGKSKPHPGEEKTSRCQWHSLSKNTDTPTAHCSAAANGHQTPPDQPSRAPMGERSCRTTSAQLAGVTLPLPLPGPSQTKSLQDYLATRQLFYLVQQQKHVVFIGQSKELKLSLPPSLSSLHPPDTINNLTLPDGERCAAFVLTAEEADKWSSERLTALANQAFRVSADIIFSGVPSKSVKDTVYKANYNETSDGAVTTGNTGSVAVNNGKPSENPESTGNAFFRPVSIRTTNQHGTQLALDPPKKAFIKHAIRPGTKALDIGGAFGNAVLQAILEGAQNIHLWEINRETVDIYKDIASHKGYPIHAREHDFKKDEILAEDQGSFDVILISRVLHLFTPGEIESAAKKLYRLLKPGGVMHVTGETPFIQVLESYIPVYLEKIKNKESWPGFLNEEDTVKYFESKRLKNHRGVFTFFDLNSPATTFRNAGFEVLYNKYLSRVDGEGRHEAQVILKNPEPRKYQGGAVEGNSGISDTDSSISDTAAESQKIKPSEEYSTNNKNSAYQGKESIWLTLKKPLQND